MAWTVFVTLKVMHDIFLGFDFVGVKESTFETRAGNLEEKDKSS